MKILPVEQGLRCEGQIEQPQDMAEGVSCAERAEGKQQEWGLVLWPRTPILLRAETEPRPPRMTPRAGVTLFQPPSLLLSMFVWL